MKVFHVIAFLLLFFYGCLSTAYGQGPAQGFDATAMKATLALYMQRTVEGKPASEFACTAFVIGKDATGYTLLSAGHCAYNEFADVTFAVSDTIGGPLTPVTVVTARFDKDRGDNDLLVLHYNTTKSYPVLELGTEADEHIGSAVLVPHFAMGTVAQLSHGEIGSGRIDQPDDLQLNDMRGEYIIHLAATRGASGSPVISATTHKVVGILIGEYYDVGFFVEPASIVPLLLKAPNQFADIHKPQPKTFQEYLEEQ